MRKKSRRLRGSFGVEVVRFAEDVELASYEDEDVLAMRERALAAGDADELLRLVRQLVLRSLGTVADVCRRLGADAGLADEWIESAIQDATVKLLLRLLRPVRVRTLSALAARISRECALAQSRRPAPNAAPPLGARLSGSRGSQRTLRLVQNSNRNSRTSEDGKERTDGIG